MNAKPVLTPAPLSAESTFRHPAPQRQRRLGLWLFRAVSALGLIGFGIAVGYEMRTSALQAHLLPQYTAKLSYELGDGPSTQIAFPKAGPFDDRRGYSHIGTFQTRLEAEGFQVDQQARVSAELARLIKWGVNPPYHEPAATGLTIRGRGGVALYDAVHNDRQFTSFDEIPPLLVATLLFIENRELLQPFDPRANPAIEWDRVAKAGLLYTGNKLGLPIARQGGSTLAIQLEKYRHSPGGRTNSLADKLRQVAAATLRAYRHGSDTSEPRRAIVVDYFNTAPLAAASGYGEIYGLGDGLYAWFGLQLADVRSALAAPEAPLAKVHAYKHALALLVALRAPTYYLQKSRPELDEKVNEYARLLAASGVIDEAFADAVAATPLSFIPRAPVAPPPPFSRQKAPNAIRTTLMRALDVRGLYELDRLHLEVESPIDLPLQLDVERLFKQLTEPAFVKANGLNQERLLHGADPANVIYSLMLFERTSEGNLLRVQADNLDRPLDINDGVKLDLGSTAKLRTLAHYLEIIALLYRELSPLDPALLDGRARSNADPLTKWVAETLHAQPTLNLEGLLQAALERKYSASPYESFFTGGGAHTFQNFDKDDNGRIMTVRRALRSSTNLVFIRLMRDLVRYHRERLDYDASALLDDPTNPARTQLLETAADEEARALVYKSYRRYREHDVVARLLGSRRHSSRHLAMVFFAWHHGASVDDLVAWLSGRTKERVTVDLAQRLTRAYGGQHLVLSDYGYLLSRHPLDLWVAGQMAREPGLGWNELLQRSAPERRLIADWLLKTRNRRAQDTRLRIHVERDAFARMTPYWQRLGFPFDRLVPTYATAIGNSSDRPAALAELMGIIINDGVRRPTLRLTRIHLGAGTPYETSLVPRPRDGEPVMDPAVAQALRGALTEVVDTGTARRVAGAFRKRDGTRVAVGGKTGSGDNRFKTFNRYGGVLSARAVNRTATFVFFIGDRYFGVVTALVPGKQAGAYSFTSALSVTALKLLAPAINPRLDAPADEPRRDPRRWARGASPLQKTALDQHDAWGG